jgi:hypothetical protein
MQVLKRGFKWPALDTHSLRDEQLAGMSNHHVSDDLIIPAMFCYIRLNMQTSYEVNGCENRALRLAHSQRLAQRWLIQEKKETLAQQDIHYNTCVLFTIQRACDNAMRTVLYGYRNPAQNFGLAWLPGSALKQFLLCMVVLAVLCYVIPIPSMGLFLGASAHGTVPGSYDSEEMHLFGKMLESASVIVAYLSEAASWLVNSAILYSRSIPLEQVLSRMYYQFWETSTNLKESALAHRERVCVESQVILLVPNLAQSVGFVEGWECYTQRQCLKDVLVIQTARVLSFVYRC